MFPNAQDALPLPRRPNVERYRKLAKELAKACRLNMPDSISDWTEKWILKLVKLHSAAIGGQFEVIKLLLEFKPPLESKNTYGGTVLGQTLWSAAHGGNRETYAAIIETLIEAGAKVPERHVPFRSRVGIGMARSHSGKGRKGRRINSGISVERRFRFTI